MKFGYFFEGVVHSATGANARVSIRPMEGGADAIASGAKVVIAIPIHTALAALSLEALAAHCLQSAQQLLPESALNAWAQTWGPGTLQQPAIPEGAAQLFESFDFQP